jgi:hypothetical protein
MIVAFQMGLSVLVGLLGAPGQSLAQGGSVFAQNETRSEACAGGTAIVGGSQNTIVFSGACTGLQIRGEGNNVSILLHANALIDIEGSNNRVRYATEPGAPPRLRVMGGGTEIAPSPGAAFPTAETAILRGDGQTVSLDCAGATATLEGARNRFVLRGACKAITVRGEANMVRADLAPNAQILIEGNAISVIYALATGAQEPQMTIRGTGSLAIPAQGDIPAVIANPSSKPAIAPSGPALGLAVLVHDLDATIVESGTLVALPAAIFGTASATPQLSEAGEIQLARLAALIGQINPSGLRLTGHDISPQAGSQRAGIVRAWLQVRATKTLPASEGGDAGPLGVDVLILR